MNLRTATIVKGFRWLRRVEDILCGAVLMNFLAASGLAGSYRPAGYVPLVLVALLLAMQAIRYLLLALPSCGSGRTGLLVSHEGVSRVIPD